MGIYNLPKEEQEKYSNDEIDYKAYYQKSVAQKTRRVTKTISPINDESLLLYLTRLRANLEALDEQSDNEHMYGPRGPWYVHKRAQNCFICDYRNMCNQQIDILIDLTAALPQKLLKRLAFASTKEGSQRLTLTSA